MDEPAELAQAVRAEDDGRGLRGLAQDRADCPHRGGELGALYGVERLQKSLDRSARVRVKPGGGDIAIRREGDVRASAVVHSGRDGEQALGDELLLDTAEIAAVEAEVARELG